MKGNIEYLYSVNVVVWLQDVVKNRSISETLRFALEQKIIEPDACYIVDVWVPFLERMKSGEDVVKTILSQPEVLRSTVTVICG